MSPLERVRMSTKSAGLAPIVDQAVGRAPIGGALAHQKCYQRTDRQAWGGDTESDRCRRWRDRSAWARGIDRLLAGTKIAAAGGKRRRVGFYSAVRREVPIRTFNDWQDPPPGFCEIDMVAHGGTSVAGSFIQTLTMVDVATGWTECLPLVRREGNLVVEAIKRAQSLFPWISAPTSTMTARS